MTDLAILAEDQLSMFGFSADGSLVLTVHPEDGSEPRNEVVAIGFPDFRFDDAAERREGGPVARARANLAAVRVLRDLQSAPRSATRDEQAVLAQYIGWGAFPGVFVPGHPEWGRIGADLRDVLSPEEWRGAEESTPTANHTPGAVIRFVYRVLARLGIDGPAWQGLHALEPGLGSGAFIGHGPAPESGVRWTGIELEPVAGAIAQALYPSADIRIGGFQHAILPRDAFDLVVGNVPFGNFPVHDPVFNPRLFSIHNYFILKSLALARPGGLVAVITSRYTLDQIDASARAALAERADLVTAVRLPDTAFRGRAVQRVTTDLLVLRRRGPAEAAAGPAWLDTVEVATPDGPARINEYFAAHPEQMAGHLRLTGKNQFRSDEPAVVLPPRSSQEAEFDRVLALLPEDVYRPRRESGAIDFRDADAAAGLADGAYKVVRGRLRRWMGGRWVFHGLRKERDVYRVVSLCAIRDAQREVLRTQDRDCTEAEQEAARRELNRLYDAFVHQYGPINLERRVVNRQGKSRIHRPNLDAFRADPYAMNVAALEHYDADTLTVRKAAIFAVRVVRPTVVVDRADTAEDALLLCLDRAACVDLGLIARLWGRTEADVVRELGGRRIFLDPATEAWETDDAYLSGAVRRKLREARAAAERDPRFAVNVEALEYVQPEDIPPSGIYVALGANWIDRKLVLQFVRELLEVGPGAGVQIAYVEKEALWALRAPRRVRESLRAQQIWGTPRAGAIRLIEDLLNQRATVIYDTVKDESGRETTVRNAAASVSAQEKAQEIADEFKRWVWRDGDRAEYLVRRYNDAFNDCVPRVYDGSHLTFPGLSTAFVPEDHQRNVVWQILCRGSTGVAHPVGAGKTLVAILASMRQRQLGLATKPMHATMGHMLEQYSREFLQAYPQARLLTAHVQDVSTRDGRRLFFARAASGEYDAIIVTHSAAERLGMSEEYERAFLENEVEEFRRLRSEAEAEEGERSLTVKQLQIVLKQFEARLASLGNRPAKDTNLTFEELGVDQLYIDEVHLFKNAATRTKISGIPRATRPSARASDLMMKCSYLNAKRAGHGVVTMTATLISNTIAEVHVHLRYLAPDLLRRYGIEHFDAFAANFIERRLVLEVSPDGGGFRVRERFHFANVPELHDILSQSVDIQLAESFYDPPAGTANEDAEPEIGGGSDTELDPPPSVADRPWAGARARSRRRKPLLKLPRPRVLGGRPETVTEAPTRALLRFTEELVLRAERIRDGGVDPHVDNMLAVTTDGRKAALDMRLIDPGLPDDPGSKVNLLVDKVFSIWEETRDERGVQLIFCDLSTPHPDGRFNIYDDARLKLIARGVPAGEIAFMQEASTPLEKAALQAEVRTGLKRITFGSTETMGTGTHFPDYVVAMHHLDSPYRPSDIEQRDGRGVRRGNRNAFVRIVRYVTERSFDAYIWNLLHYKLLMIYRLLLGDRSVRQLADNDPVTLSFAEVKALATGNPLILEKANLDAEIARLERARAAFVDRQVRLRTARGDLPRRLAAAEAVLEAVRADLETRVDTAGDAFRITVGETEYTVRSEGGAALKQAIEQACYACTQRTRVRIGHFAGFELHASVHPKMQLISAILRGAREYEGELELFQAPASLAQTLEWIPRKLEGIFRSHQESVDHLRAQVARLQEVTEETFLHEAELAARRARQREIIRLLQLDGPAERQDIGALPTADAEDDSEPGVDDGEDGDEPLPLAA